MRKTFFVIASLTFLSQNLFASATWPNEPAGSHMFLDCPFNNLGECHITGPGGTIVSDATAPVSPSSVAKSSIAAGASSGGSELHYYAPQLNKELYAAVMWRTNSQFQGRQVGNKLFFVRGPRLNGVFNMDGPPGGPWVMNFHPNTSGLDNGHACGGDAIGSTCSPNSGAGGLARGVWTKLEAYVKASTTTTSRDGVVKWWVNGQLAGNYTNLNYGPLLNEWVWSETWDGYVNPAPTVEWNHYIDHLYVSAPNFVLSVPKILTDTIPSSATSGKPYAAYMKASGGMVPYSWTISSGNLPGGLTIGKGTGVISGVPNTCGLHNFTVKLADANYSTATKNFSINVTGTCTGTLVSGNGSSNANESFAVKARAGAITIGFPSSQQGKYQLSIFDLSGKVVYAGAGLGQKEMKISTKLTNGVYLVKLIQGSRSSTVRFNVLN